MTSKTFMSQLAKFRRIGLEWARLVFLESESLLNAEIMR